ncbi:MAG: hypothetical protein AAF074_20415, partial [Pseudomonadota bacterium]
DRDAKENDDRQVFGEKLAHASPSARFFALCNRSPDTALGRTRSTLSLRLRDTVAAHQACVDRVRPRAVSGERLHNAKNRAEGEA